MFKLRFKNSDKHNVVNELLVELIMNYIHEEQIRKGIEEKFACKSEYWIGTEYVERVKDYWDLSYGNYFVKSVEDEGLEDEVNELNAMSLHLGVFVLSNSRRIMNNFNHIIYGFFSSDFYSGETESLDFED